ncbi:MAG: hypothetical protein AAF492_05835 [Verrucomicrobiota bacterium]
MKTIIITLSAISLTALTSMADTAHHITGKCKASTVINGLNRPDGLALHPATGDLYVSEKGSGRIRVIRPDGRTETVIGPNGWQVHEAIESWAITPSRPRSFILDPQLVEPGSIAFSPQGHLFVVEDRADGRLLEFFPDNEGRYTLAAYRPVPWLDKAFAWEDMKIDRDGRIFLVGYDAGAKGLLQFGSVLMKDVDQDWWVMDYGPMSRFSAVTLTRDDAIAVVCERHTGEIVTWDIARQAPMDTAHRTVSKGDVESNCLLRDGSYVIAATGDGDTAGSRLLKIDGSTQQATLIAGGLEHVGSVILHPKSGDLFVSDVAAGAVYRIKPNPELTGTAYRLVPPRSAFGTSKTLNSRMLPVILKGLLSSRGAERTDESDVHGEKGETNPDAPPDGSTINLKDFMSRFPMIAGKVRTMQIENDPFKDPVVELEFVLFFPANVVKSSDSATPSLSFFAARRRSGKEERSQMFSDNFMSSLKVGDDWILQSDKSEIYLPLTSCGIGEDEDGIDVSITFLGLSVLDDYFLNINVGRENGGMLIVEDKFGKDKATYPLTITDKKVAGENPDPNLMITGFDQATKSQDLSWLNIGQWPVGQAISLNGSDVTEFHAVDPEITEVLINKQVERQIKEADQEL